MTSPPACDEGYHLLQAEKEMACGRARSDLKFEPRRAVENHKTATPRNGKAKQSAKPVLPAAGTLV
jgi:hypothetical protein